MREFFSFRILKNANLHIVNKMWKTFFGKIKLIFNKLLPVQKKIVILKFLIIPYLRLFLSNADYARECDTNGSNGPILPRKEIFKNITGCSKWLRSKHLAIKWVKAKLPTNPSLR